jgi:hypothetical protein
MNRLGGWWLEAWGSGLGAERPWYRRSDLWLLAAALMVPFGWLVPVCRLAWARAGVRRPRRF